MSKDTEHVIKANRSKVDLKLKNVQRRNVKERKKEEILDKHPYVKAPSVFRVIKDVGEIAKNTRIEDAWEHEVDKIALAEKFDADRLPSPHRPFSPSWILEKYRLRGIEFGNWTSQEDRLNYTFALALSLYDLKNILGFSYNQIGFKKKLGVAFGARGRGKANAHFEPRGFVINITRYSEEEEIGEGGGVGALSHEYGHALDFFLGRKDKILSINWVSGGSNPRTNIYTELYERYPDSPRAIVEEIFDNLIWEKRDKKLTSFWKQLREKVDNTDSGEYWIRRNEVFARTFEAWLQKRMKKRGMRNNFLTKYKYKNVFYPDNNLIQKVDPLFERLLKKARSII